LEREHPLQRRIERLRNYDKRVHRDLERDISRYKDVRAQNRETVTFQRQTSPQAPSVPHGPER
jgi:hypothetical protein